MVFRLRDNQTTYVLMNKDRPVVRFAYDFGTHSAVKVLDVIDAAYAPTAILRGREGIDRSAINRWWHSRSIPASREQFKSLMASLDMASALELAERSYGLSLSDRYWVNDERNPQEWETINFFDNDFTDDLGIITLGQSSSSESIDLFSPNSTVGGNLPKKWTIIDGERCLVKAGSGLFNQEPYNETIATCLYGRLLESEDFVPYTLLRQDRRVYSCCPNMLRDDEELVSAIDLIPRWQSPTSLEEVRGLARRYESLGIRDARRAIDKMLTCDFILANTDRHYRNFGLIRDCVTLEYTRVAPLFDSGHSLWCTTQELELPSDYEYVAKPFGFNGTPSREVLGLVSDLEWFEADRLDGFIQDVEHALAKNKLMPARRIDQVCVGVERGIKAVKERAVELGRVEACMGRVTRDMSVGHDDRTGADDDAPMGSGGNGRGAVGQPHGNVIGNKSHAGIERLMQVAEAQGTLGSPSSKGIDEGLSEGR